MIPNPITGISRFNGLNVKPDSRGFAKQLLGNPAGEMSQSALPFNPLSLPQTLPLKPTRQILTHHGAPPQWSG